MSLELFMSNSSEFKLLFVTDIVKLIQFGIDVRLVGLLSSCGNFLFENDSNGIKVAIDRTLCSLSEMRGGEVYSLFGTISKINQEYTIAPTCFAHHVNVSLDELKKRWSKVQKFVNS